jgi:hypothetical protein
MAAVPEGDWFCDACADAKREKDAAEARVAAGDDPSPLLGENASPPPAAAIADPAAADPEDPDPRLAMKSLRDMVEYYYNAWLTRPNVEDDDGDRSVCSDDEETNPFVAAAAAKRRGGGGGGGKTAGATTTGTTTGTGTGTGTTTTTVTAAEMKEMKRAASAREMARLSSGPTARITPKRPPKPPCAKAESAKATKKVGDLLTWLHAAAGGGAARAKAAASAHAPSRKAMMARWRETWSEMDGDDAAAAEEAARRKKVVGDVFHREKKHPNAREVAFSSDDEA